MAATAFAVLLAGCTSAPSASGPQDSSSPASNAQSVTLQAGEIGGTVDAIPEVDARIDATGPDGSVYRLEIPAFALATPTTIALRPLTEATIPSASLVAGVEIEPSGLELRLPATLTIIPSAGAAAGNPADVVSLEYAGSGEATAVLGALDLGSAPGEHSILLTHFSGGMVAQLDVTGENLWLQRGTFNTSTVDGRQAQAEHAIRVLEHAVETGKLTKESALSSSAVWQRQWWEAERDRLTGDPDIKTAVEAADVTHLEGVLAEVAKMQRIASELKRLGDTDAAGDIILEVQRIQSDLSVRVVDKMQHDADLQHKIDSGLVSDLVDLRSILNTILSFERAAALGRDSATADLLHRTQRDFIHRIAVALGCSCARAGLDPLLAVGLLRMAEFSGDQEAIAVLEPCVLPTASIQDPPLVTVGGAAITLAAAVTPWRAVAAGNPVAAACGSRLVGTAHGVYRFPLGGILTLDATGVIWERTVTQGGSSIFEVVAGQLTYTETQPNSSPYICGSGTEPLKPDQVSTVDQNGGGGIGDGALLDLQTAIFDPPRFQGSGHVELHACPLSSFDWFRTDGYVAVTPAAGGYLLAGTTTISDVFGGTGELTWSFRSE